MNQYRIIDNVLSEDDLIKIEQRQEMINDLIDRTGLDIVRVEIGKIDLLRDLSLIHI